MRIHFIAIGGAVMHNLAIALHKKGYIVTGSDDEIFEPSKSRLEKYGILPKDYGWYPEKLSEKIDAVILGMHARPDNPELVKARETGLKIYSFPEYLYEQTKHKRRVVIGGSHGKTSITSMIMHVLKKCKVEFDYMVGSQIEGFETMVGFSEESEIAIFEGDEYLSSPIDRRPKFHLYKPDIGLISGIAWDHINVFPTFENYVEQFKIFINKIEEKGHLVWFEKDAELQKLCSEKRKEISYHNYNSLPHKIENGVTYLPDNEQDYSLKVFGDHNLQNIAGAKIVCEKLGISSQEFLKAISDFSGAAKRLQLLDSKNNCSIFLDFAHAPSKLKATVSAVRQQFPDRKLIAAMELHTFSSLNKKFLPQYNNSMKDADEALVYFNPKTVNHKKLEAVSKQEVVNAFGGSVMVYDDSSDLRNYLLQKNFDNSVLLLMSSGNFDGIVFKDFAKEILSKI